MRSEQKSFQGILFDLDGTLLDTATDLGQALNQVLLARGLAPLAQTAIRPAAGRGCKGLLKLGLNMDETHPLYTDHCNELLQHYQHHLLDTTQLFAGMDEVLAYLDNINMPWGIVTNKPKRFTQALVEALSLNKRASCIISGDTLQHRKPHPEPILHACELMQLAPKDCLYVGDAEVDTIASHAAGTTSLVALYGYIPESEQPEKWHAEGYIKHPTDILSWISP